MAIGTRTKPRVIVIGGVSRTREFRRKIDQELLGHNVEIETPGGGVSLTYWLSDGGLIPSVGEYVAVVAGVDEGRDAQLVWIADFSETDLDELHSMLFAKVK